MGKVDICSWGEFPLIELFDFYLSKGDNQAQKLDEGEIPLVSSGSFNNGICKYIDKGDGISELYDYGLITIDMFGQSFYQNKPFYAVSHGRVNILKPKFEINEQIGLFIASVMQKMYYEKYGFATMCSQTKLKKECIKLPINSQGEPDWVYMEDYMRNLETTVSDSLTKLQSAKDSERKKIDTSSWGEFRLGKLLDLKTKDTKGTGLFNIVNSVAYHGKDIEETDENTPDGLNYVTRSKFNNGIKCKVVKKDLYTINPAGTISFGAENADFFYQTEEYITGNKMYYIDTSALSKYSCAFLKSVLEATFTANYSFSDGMIPARIYDEVIKLPIDINGESDWVYMEDYMRNLETTVSNSLTKLQSALFRYESSLFKA